MRNGKIRNTCYSLLIVLLSCGSSGYSQPAEVVHLSTMADSGKLREQIAQAISLVDTYPDSAQSILNIVFRQSANIGFRGGMQNSLGESMAIQFRNKNYQRVIILADRLIKMSDPVKDKEILFAAYENKASSLFLTSQYYPASDAYTMALKFIPQNRAADKANIYSNIGSILLTLKLPDKAIVFYDLAISSGYQHGAFEVVCRTYTGKGYIARCEKDYQKSAVYIDSAIWLANAHRLYNNKQSALVFKADLLNHQSKFEEALTALNEAGKILRTYPQLGNKDYRLYSIRGDTYLLSRDYTRAKKAYNTALSIITYDENGRIYLLHRLSQLYARTHDYKKAYDLHCETHNLSDSLVRQEASDKASELEVRYRVAEKDKEITGKNLQISLAQKNLAQKNLLIVSVSLSTLVLLLIIFHLYRSYHKKKKLAEKEKEIAQLRSIMEGEEKERKRLSRELHDGIGGMLVALKLKVNHLKKSNADPDLLHQIYDITDMLKDTSAEVRTTAHNLLPDILSRLPLSEAIAHYVDSINHSGAIRIQLHIPYILPPMNKSVELILYRILQELIQNVIKHAEASDIEVQLFEHQGILTLTIEDNGIGFDTKVAGGYGLENLRYRVQGLQGEIDIDSAPQQNTTIRIAFDIENLTLVAHA